MQKQDRVVSRSLFLSCYYVEALDYGGPVTRTRGSRSGAGAGVEVSGRRVDDRPTCCQVCRSDTENAAAVSAELRQNVGLARRNFRILWFKSRSLAKQPIVVECAEQVAHAVYLGIGRTEVLLPEFCFAQLTGSSLIRQIGQWRQVEQLIDETNHRAVFGTRVRDCVNDAVRRDHDCRNTWDPGRAGSLRDPASGQPGGCGHTLHRFRRR